MKTVLFLSHFSPSKLFCQERGSLPYHTARRHSGSALWSPGEIEQEIQNWWRALLLLSIWPSHTKPSGYYHMESRRYYHWRPRNHGHVASHGWPHSRSRSSGIIPGGEGPIIGIVGVPIASTQPGNDSHSQADKGGQRTKTSAMMGQISMILRSDLFGKWAPSQTGLHSKILSHNA